MVRLIACLAVSVPGIVNGQSAVAQRFEVASVKPSQDNSPAPRITTDPSGLNWHNVTLKFLIQVAYGKKDYSLTAPDWLADTRYDVAAKLPAGTTLSDSSTMLQSLLTERFKLAIHHEQKLMSVYELHVGKDDLKLHAADARMHLGYGAEGRHLTGGLAMKQLADIVSRDLDRPLLDKTGLTGKFDVDLTWRPDRTAGPAPSASEDVDRRTVFSELRDKLGLTVTSGKAPIDTIVVDRVERIPTEN